MKKGHHLFQIVSFFDLSLLASVNKVSILNAFKGLLYRHTPKGFDFFYSQLLFELLERAAHGSVLLLHRHIEWLYAFRHRILTARSASVI